MSAQGDMRKLLAHATQQGFRAEQTSGGHWKVLAPNGRDIIVMSGTPSDRRSWDNFLAQMKRAGYDQDWEAPRPQSAPPTPAVEPEATAIAQAMEAALRESKPDAPAVDEPRPQRKTVPHDEPSASDVILSLMCRRSAPVTVGECVDELRVRRPGMADYRASTSESLRRLMVRGDVRRVGRGTYALASDDPEARPQRGITEGSQPHAVVDGDDAIMADVAKLDAALDALAEIEGVVKRNRELLLRLAALRKVLGGIG